MRPRNQIWHFHPPSTALRCPTESSTEAASGTARMRPRNQIWRFHPPSTALRGPTQPQEAQLIAYPK
eukprot:2639880-Pyramimonas_sp.AAC.1